MTTPENRDWLEQLLADEATQGLGELERRELETVLGETGTEDRHGFERAAAAAELAFLAARQSDDVPVPDSLDRRLSALAEEAPEALRSGGDLLTFPAPDVEAPQVRSEPSSTAWWLLAAAALVALIGWGPRLFDRPGNAPVVEEAAATETPAPSEAPAPDQIRLALAGTEDAAGTGASGELVWSTSSQSGVMRIAGLAANDPSVSQYQLWIFDAAQDERHPIDGGVFDFPGGEAEIAIDAKIRVQTPTLFAVTVEKPGGVVVSARERIVLVAPVA